MNTSAAIHFLSLIFLYMLNKTLQLKYWAIYIHITHLAAEIRLHRSVGVRIVMRSYQYNSPHTQDPKNDYLLM